jgi:hypothetical protein
MAAKTEETAIGTVERELAEYTKQKGEAETALKEELAKAKTEYDAIVKEITSKHNVEELTQKIKRHTYFFKLLKGEVAIPDDLNAKKGKAGTSSSAPASGKVRVDWSGKWEAAFSKAGKTVADGVTLGQIKPTLFELFPSFSTLNPGTLNAAFNDYKKKHKV